MNIQNRYNEGYYRRLSKLAYDKKLEKRAFNVKSILRNLASQTGDLAKRRYLISESAPEVSERVPRRAAPPPGGGSLPSGGPTPEDFAPEFVPGRKPNWANIATDAGIAGGTGLLAASLAGGGDEASSDANKETPAGESASATQISPSSIFDKAKALATPKNIAYTLAGILVMSGLSRLFAPRRRRRQRDY